jgi:hypothetical protein
MPLSETSTVEIIYTDLDSTLGCYVINPYTGCFIFIKSDLDEALKKEICDSLVNYHESIPVDSAYRLFKMIVCYEDLPKKLEVSNVIILGRFKPRRCFTYTSYIPGNHRLIGN